MKAKNIYHLASRAYGIGYSSKNHIETLLHNEKITNNLVEVFTESKPENVLIASSSCVYKDGGPDTVQKDTYLMRIQKKLIKDMDGQKDF